MIVIKSPIELDSLLKSSRINNHTIGFVPTMGALHHGHLSLIKQCKSENDITVCSIFVNPKQFNEVEDLNKYPRPIEKDIILLQESGTDILFLPSIENIYPSGYKQPVFELNEMDNLLEGASRPGHFRGVAMVIERLFYYVNPSKAYFGQKDFQQILVIQKILKQFNFKAEIIICEIVREPNGLAMSSRNSRLSEVQRESAGFIYESLLQLKLDVKNLPLQPAIEKAKKSMTIDEAAHVEYLVIADSSSLSSIEHIADSNKAIALVVVNYFGVRLLDNIYLS